MDVSEERLFERVHLYTLQAYPDVKSIAQRQQKHGKYKEFLERNQGGCVKQPGGGYDGNLVGFKLGHLETSALPSDNPLYEHAVFKQFLRLHTTLELCKSR